MGFWLSEVQILLILLLTGSTCPSSRDCLCTMFSCRLLFGPTVVTYFVCNKEFIYWLRSYVYVYSCHFPHLLFVYHCSFIGFSQYFSHIFVFYRYLSIWFLGPLLGRSPRQSYPGPSWQIEDDSTVLKRPTVHPCCTTALTASGRNSTLVRRCLQDKKE